MFWPADAARGLARFAAAVRVVAGDHLEVEIDGLGTLANTMS